MPAKTPSERKSIATEGAHISWANTLDRTARTQHGRDAFNQTFLDDADGDPIRAEHLRKAHFTRMSRLSANARRKASRPVPEGTEAEQDEPVVPLTPRKRRTPPELERSA